jgi:hypothetical protein
MEPGLLVQSYIPELRRMTHEDCGLGKLALHTETLSENKQMIK